MLTRRRDPGRAIQADADGFALHDVARPFAATADAAWRAGDALSAYLPHVPRRWRLLLRLLVRRTRAGWERNAAVAFPLLKQAVSVYEAEGRTARALEFTPPGLADQLRFRVLDVSEEQW